MGLFILSSFSLFLCLPFSLNLEAEYVPFEEQLGCRSDYCFIQWLRYFPTSLLVAGPEDSGFLHYNPVSLQNHQEEIEPKEQAMAKLGLRHGL